MDQFPSNDIYHFIPPPAQSRGPSASTAQYLAGPSSGATGRSHLLRWSLDDDEDSRVVEEHPTAGRLIQMNETLHERWKRLFRHRQADDPDIEMADEEADSGSETKNPFYPFASRRDWEIAYWFIREEPGHKAFDRFLRIPGIRESLGLSYDTVRAMLELIQSIPERAGQWYVKRLSFQDRPDQKFTIRYRNVLDGICSLWGDPALSKHLVYKPRHVFTDATRQKRIYSEMSTGNWWHAIQSRLPAGATLAPIIIATDKTQLTQFSGGKAAYPIYLTLGNLPKVIRRKPSLHPCVLLGYLSVDKHLTTWCSRVLTPAELDRRIRTLPPAFGVRHFKNGISALSQVSGSERKNIYSTHNDETLGYMQEALRKFHTNKVYFIHAGIRDDLNIPKFHSLLHYLASIKMLGTTDNYNTEMFERLHIDFAKAGWRASNQRDKFPQMINWLSRQEKMWQFESYISSLDPTLHNAAYFSRALKEYLNTFLAQRTSTRVATLHSLPFTALDVYHQFKFNPDALEDDEEENDVVKAMPAFGPRSGRFDSVVVLNTDDAESTGLQGTRIARVKVIFRLPKTTQAGDAPPIWPTEPLAYVEWYTSLKSVAEPHHKILYAYKTIW
ncbi:hypothetical protein LXA43DRAFT_976331 [Ganoderma leucocontextum]|nr:hypothetical protein LXA43DRAFT_976331 [Ganoderma leucocontextum]